jgi:hypothetical protein
LAQAEALNATAALDGVPIALLRLSFADTRERQRGVSHHTLTGLGIICLAEAVVPLPLGLPEQQLDLIEQQLEESGIADKHGIVDIAVNVSAIDLRGLAVTTMGRTQVEDPSFFSAAFAAGIFAAELLAEKR